MHKKKILGNISSSLINRLVTIICGLILPRFLLLYYGSSVNGLVSSITQFLSFVSFMDMGIGAVVQSSLYKPLSVQNNNEISRIMKSAHNFFSTISIIYVIYIIALCFVYPLIVNSGFEIVFTVVLILILSITSLMQYYIGIVNQLLLNADQKAYIPLNLNSITIVLNTIVSFILMSQGFGVHFVYLSTAIIYLARPIGMNLYVRKYYQIDNNVHLSDEPIQQKWNGIAQHIAAMVLEHTDVAILTLLSTLQNVSIYSVYYNVVSGIRRIFSTMVDSIRPTFGNIIAKNEREKLLYYYDLMEYIVHIAVALFFACTLCLIVPFVQVYTIGVDDVNYYMPVFGAVITIAYAFYCLRGFYNMLIMAVGHYKQTQNAAIIEAMINVVISTVMVNKYGLIGVSIGTLLAMFYRCVYLIWYLSKNIIYRPCIKAITHIIADVFEIILCYVLCHRISLVELSFTSWMVLAVKVFGLCSMVVIIMNMFIYSSQTKELVRILKRRWK